MRQKSDWLGLALEDGGSPYYKRGRGDRSAIDSESLPGWTVVTPLLNVALCVCALPVDLFGGGGSPRSHRLLKQCTMQCCNAVIIRCLQFYTFRIVR